MWTRSRTILLAALSVLMLVIPVRGDEFFNLVATGSGGTTVVDSGGNIIHLTDRLISLDSGFFLLTGQNVNASMSWGGVPNALIFTENAGQTAATLSFPTTGFTRGFVGVSASDLQNQIHDFIKHDGARAYANFLESMDRLSPVASLDGNPQASTALIADDVFNRFGIVNQQPTVYRNYAGGAYIGIAADGGGTRAADLNGNWADVTIDSGIRFGSHVALSLGTTLAYRDVGGSESYTVAEELALPITIINNQGDGLSWQVSPWAYAGLSASYDQAAGGVLVGGGATSSVALHLGTFTATLGDQISYTGNVDVNVNEYSFDTRIDQWIFKNGVEGRYRFPRSPFFVDAGITYSNFLRQAAVPNYWTPTGGVGLAFDKYSSIRVGYRGDYGRHYNSTGGEVALVVVY